MTRILGLAFILIVSLAAANAVAQKYTACPSLKKLYLAKENAGQWMSLQDYQNALCEQKLNPVLVAVFSDASIHKFGCTSHFPKTRHVI